MTWHDVDLQELLACCRREVATRQRVYPKWIERGFMTQAKADREIELMKQCCEFFVDVIFRRVTRQPDIVPLEEGDTFVQVGEALPAEMRDMATKRA